MKRAARLCPRAASLMQALEPEPTAIRIGQAGPLSRLKVRWWSNLTWPIAGLGLLLLFNCLFTPGFFHVEIRNGYLYGTLIDILNHGSKVMLLALGMALVIATGGVDLSVGAVMAFAGAVAAQLINKPNVPFPAVIACALAVAVAAGCWN